MDKLEESSRQADIETVLGVGKGSPKGLFSRPARWKWLLALAAVAVGAGLYAYWLQGQRTTSIRYSTEPAVVGDLTVIVTATGSVQPTRMVEVSSELSGTIRKVLVDYNDPVKVGQTLAELDTDKIKAQVASYRAKLAAAQARVEDAKATVVEKQLAYERKKELAEKKVISGQDLDTAKAAYERALASLASTRADVVAAEAELKLRETDLTKSCICSPIDGVVLARNIDPGQTVASSFQAPVLFTIAEDLKQMEIQVDVDEADVGKVKEGQKSTFTVDAYPERTFEARIRELRFGSEVVQGVVTYKAVLSTDNSELLLRPGMTATAEINVQEVKQGLVVPNAALRFSPAVEQAPRNNGGFLQKILPRRPQFRPPSKQEDRGPKRTVWVLRDGNPAAVPVVVGVSDGRRTEIREGEIRAGQEVIVGSSNPGKK